MSWNFGESDLDILELLRVSGSCTVSDLAREFRVTDTAVRQRLARLLADGAVERESLRRGRGRPRHVYKLTRKGMLQVGSNFTDLAVALWHGIQRIENPTVKEQVLRSVARELARLYQGQISGGTTGDRMRSLIRVLEARRIPFEMRVGGMAAANGPGGARGAMLSVPDSSEDVDLLTAVAVPGGKAHQASRAEPEGLPMLVARACPYPELADGDRGVCRVEAAYLSELLGTEMQLTECRLDGGECCRFEATNA